MKFEKTLRAYIEKLENYSDEKFLQIPNDSTWSLGQVYVHVLLGNEHFFLKQADNCLNKVDTKRGRGKKFGGKVVFIINGFPNFKFKMPKSVEVAPRQPENIGDIRVKLDKALDLFKDIESRLHEFDKEEKTKHPAFGYLNAKEWVRMSEMHFRHHLRQLERIEKLVGV